MGRLENNRVGFPDISNNSALEHLVMSPTRQQVILDLILCGTPDLVRNVNVTEPLGNREHAVIHFTGHVGGRVSSKSEIKTLSSERWTPFK